MFYIRVYVFLDIIQFIKAIEHFLRDYIASSKHGYTLDYVSDMLTVSNSSNHPFV